MDREIAFYTVGRTIKTFYLGEKAMDMHIEVLNTFGSLPQPRRYDERQVRCWKCREFVDTWSDEVCHTENKGIVSHFWHTRCWFGVEDSTLVDLYT